MPTITDDDLRASIIERLDAGDVFGFVSLAEPYLDRHADDHYVRLMCLREYLKVGLVEPARDLVSVENVPADLPDEFVTLRTQLAAMRGSTVPWLRCVERFQNNLAALKGRDVDIAPIVDDWQKAFSRFQLLEDKNGAHHVRMRRGDGWQWIPCFGNHQSFAESQPLPEDVGTQMPGPYLFEGLDLGWFFKRIYDATLDTFLGYSTALFVVEPDPSALALVLHLHDWRDVLSDRRVFWLVGPDCVDQLRRVWDDDINLPWPRQAYTLSAFREGCSPSSIDVVREACRRRENVFAESAATLDDSYADRDRAYWAKRFEEVLGGSGEPLRILAAVSTHTTFLKYSMRDAQRAFEDLGHECVVLTEDTPYHVTGPLAFHNAIKALDPDVFFILDHLRPEFGAIIPKNLPVLTWDQDCLPHVFTKANLDRVADHDFIVGCSKPRFLAFGYNGDQYLTTAVPTSPEQFSGEMLTNAERDRYACDISFVSHASQPPRAFHEEERAKYQDPGLVRLLDTMYEMMPAMLHKHRVAGAPLCSEILQNASRQCGGEIRDQQLRHHLTEWYLWRLGDRFFRHEALGWVADWAQRTGRTFRIYGNGWDKHPTLSPFAAGPAENGRELLCIHRASRINLQLMPAGFLHQRAVDGLASGGFFIARSVPGDTSGRTLRQLVDRIQELGLSTTRQLCDGSDPRTLALLEAYLGEGMRWVDRDKDDLLHGLLCNAELKLPDEVFPRIGEILFDSPMQFESLAEHFLADDGLRDELATQMREIVVEQFSYTPTINRFLHAMHAYLSGVTLEMRK